MRLLHAEVRACDRDRQAHEERTQRREQDALALRAPLEERTKQLEALRDTHADELERARREARERSAQVVRLSEELEDVKHERDPAPAATPTAGPCTATSGRAGRAGAIAQNAAGDDAATTAGACAASACTCTSASASTANSAASS